MCRSLQVLLSATLALYCSARINFLRVGYWEHPAALRVHNHGHNLTRYSGHTIDLLNWLAIMNRFEYNLTKLEYLEGFNGMGKEFLNRGLDLACPQFALREGRNKIAAYLFPYWEDVETLIIPYPTRETNPWSCLKPYQLTVWLVLIGCGIAVPIVLKVTSILKQRTLEKNEKGKRESFTTVSATSMYVLGVVTNQGAYCSSKTRSSRVIAATWCLAAIVLVNAYSGSLITYLATSERVPLIRNLEDLFKRDDLQLMAVQNDYPHVYLQGLEGYLKPIAKNLARVPRDYCGGSVFFSSPEFQHCLQKVKEGSHLFALERYDGTNALWEDFKVTKKCALAMVKQPFLQTYSGFVVPLHTSHETRNILDIGILRAVSYGLTQKWRDVYTPPWQIPCLNYESTSHGTRRLSLTELRTAFVILGIGYCLSSLAFFYEILANRSNLKVNILTQF